MKILFTAWDYHVTYLETAAVIVAIIGVALAIKGTRWAWPFYLLSALLYGWLFVEVDLIASAWLQIIFVVAAIWGWFDWGSAGISQSKSLTMRTWVVGLVGLAVLWVVLAPLLQWIGGVATWLDAFVLLGSAAAQILMVRGYVESWPMWVIVNVVGTFHYAKQGLWFTSLLYFVLLVMAMVGWRSWTQRNRLAVVEGCAATSPMSAGPT